MWRILLLKYKNTINSIEYSNFHINLQVYDGAEHEQNKTKLCPVDTLDTHSSSTDNQWFVWQ